MSNALDKRYHHWLYLANLCIILTINASPIDSFFNDNYYNILENNINNSTGKAYYLSLYENTHEESMVIVPNIINRNQISYRLDGLFKQKISNSFNTQLNYRISDNPELLEGYGGVKRNSIGTIRADVVFSSLRYKNSNMVIQLMRNSVVTSPYGLNLLFNGNNRPSENLRLIYTGDTWNYEFMIIMLQRYEQLNKTAVYHRYSKSLGKLSMGFSEVTMLLFESFNNDIVRYYLPTSILYELEENYSINTNILWRYDISFIESGEYLVWAEILIDDYSLDRLSPNKTAVLIGYTTGKLSIPISITLMKIDRWVYNYGYDQPGLKFIDGENYLGPSIGNDAIVLTIKAISKRKVMENYSYILAPSISFRGKGMGSIEEATPSPAGTNFGYSDSPFLSKPIEYSIASELFTSISYKNTEIKILLSYISKKSAIQIALAHHFSF